MCNNRVNNFRIFRFDQPGQDLCRHKTIYDGGKNVHFTHLMTAPQDWWIILSNLYLQCVSNFISECNKLSSIWAYGINVLCILKWKWIRKEDVFNDLPKIAKVVTLRKSKALKIKAINIRPSVASFLIVFLAPFLFVVHGLMLRLTRINIRSGRS